MTSMHPGEERSLAVLLDDLRPLIAAARDAGEQPRHVLLSPAAFDLVAGVKGHDRERGMPVMVLGMEIVRADNLAQLPRVF
jgi:hypothetical protein